MATLAARELISHLAGQKLYRVPQGGWNAHTFAIHGMSLLTTMTRTAKLVQRRIVPVLARNLLKMFIQQMEDVITVVHRRLRIEKGVKDPTTTLFLGSHEEIWAQAIREVFAEAGHRVVTELVPPIQSVMAQGYSKTSLILGQDSDSDRNPMLLRQSRGMAEKITRINDTTRERFRNIIGDAVKENLTVTETTEKMRTEFTEMSRRRVFTIARTELNNAWTRGSIGSFQESESITYVSVIGCEDREWNQPRWFFRGEPACNVQDVPVHEADQLEFHPNHTGTVVPSRFRDPSGAVTDQDRPAILDEPPVGGDEP